MGALFNTFDFDPGSRMTGIWDAGPMPGEENEESFVHMTMVKLGPDQDGDLESSFLGAHLPFHFGGFHGTGPDGNPWAVMIQLAPGSTMELNGASHPYWTMLDAIRRAVDFNPEATMGETYSWSRQMMLNVYDRQGVDVGQVDDWSERELLLGLLAECCHVPLGQIVAGRLTQCAFPDDQHDCARDVFSDVFARWTTGQLNPPEPDLDDIFPGLDEQEGSCWLLDELQDLSKAQLLELAQDTDWNQKKLRKLSRKELLVLLTTPHKKNR